MDTQVIIDALPEMVTQLLGFLVVFAILKRYAFGPILGAIDERRRQIEREFGALEGRKQDLDGLEKEYRGRLDRIEGEARARIQEAANAGTVLAKDIQEKARADAQRTIERARFEIEQDLAKARLGLRDQIVDLSGLMTEKILREKLDAKEHQKLVDRFLKELDAVEARK